MKITISMPESAYGIQAAFAARRFADPFTEPEKYAKTYKKIFKMLKKA